MPTRAPERCPWNESADAPSASALLPPHSRLWWVSSCGLGTRMAKETKGGRGCAATAEAAGRTLDPLLFIGLISLVTKILLPLLLRVEAEGFSGTYKAFSTVCPSPHPLPLSLLLTLLLALSQKVPTIHTPWALLSLFPLPPPGNVWLRPPFRPLLRCHLLARSSLPSLVNITTIPSLQVMPIVFRIFVE